MKPIISVDISYSDINKLKFNLLKKRIQKLDDKINHQNLKSGNMMDWLTLPTMHSVDEITKINEKVSDLRSENINTLLVIGIGGSYLGAKAGIEFMKYKLDPKYNVIFVGTDLDEIQYQKIEKKLINKKWAIAIISKSGTTLEPSLAFRYFRNLLIKNTSKETYAKYVIAITDKENGVLKKMSIKEGYTTFVIPDGIGGRFSVMTPVGLFAMAFSGININEVLEGAKEASIELKDPTLNNPAYKYAAVRYILGQPIYKFGNNKKMEIFTCYSQSLKYMNEWLKQLFAESEGKNGKGLFPTSVYYTADLHSLGQYIQQGKKFFFETTLWVDEQPYDRKIQSEEIDSDNLNYLSNKSIISINEVAFKSTLKAHHDAGKNPQVVITIRDMSAKSMGYMWQFFFLAVTMSASLIKVNPFDQPGVEIYKKLMFDSLGAPK